MTVWMVIPTGTRHTYLPALVEGSGLPLAHIVIVNTTPAAAAVPGVHHLNDLGELNIHRWWNLGIDYAQKRGATRALIVNDDVTFGPDLIPALTAAMDETRAAIAYPGAPAVTRMEGSCFLLDLASDIRPDERFRWWYGDNDMEIRAGERIAKVDVAFTHHHPNEATKASPALQEIIAADHLVQTEKWGRR